MVRLLRNRLALSTVVTTLIILVVSILLASVLTYFAINVTSTRVQEESLHVFKQHIWVDSGGGVEAALVVTNDGGRDVVINNVAVRGQTSAWGTVFTLMAAKTDPGLTADLPYLTTTPANGGVVAGFAATLATTTNNLVLPSGSTMIMYMNDPDSIGMNDIGLTVSISLHSAQAVYYSEVNVQAIPP